MAPCRPGRRRARGGMGVGRFVYTPIPRTSVALVTAGYSVGQILGPLLVAPLLHDGYRPALLLAALVVLTTASAAAVLRIGFPHHMVVVRHTVPEGQRESV
ncbi:YbfB/YjiJ family MFS transporter [Streptomyces chartreusis]|uniref:YbfB/YjiJ family MFS transporter n=1 Tax=Streptomyces chartreusis TaxID=1969 RepID=UPI00369B5B22